MISRFVSSFRKSRKSEPAPAPARNSRATARMEPLHARVLMHAQATSVFTDNRGEVQITFNSALDPTTVNTRSVFVHLPGTDQVFGTADDAKITGRVRLTAGNRRIWYRPAEKVPFIAGSSYSVKVSGRLVKSADGHRIDGEFNGAGIVSGNGTPGGDFLVLSKRNKTSQVARFSTINGNFDVRLYTTVTPENVSNFLDYVNAGSYDNLFIQRDIPGFIWQTGGFFVTPENTIDEVAPIRLVPNEPSVTTAKRGTISLARPDDQNPATDDRGSNQFFFNLADNEANLGSQNGGFTEFGEVTSDAGLAVMDALANHPIINAGGQFSDLPVQQAGTTPEQADANPQGTLITIRRIAIRNTIVAYPFPT